MTVVERDHCHCIQFIKRTFYVILYKFTNFVNCGVFGWIFCQRIF